MRHLAAFAGVALALLSTTAFAAEVYVQAGAPAGGTGAQDSPFDSLADAEAASKAGDAIILLPGTGALDGGIALKPGQKLLGRGGDGKMPQIININTPVQSGVMVRLSTNNEIAGIHFARMRNYAILGDGDFSGLKAHDNLFTGSAKSVEPIYSIHLEASGGEIRDVVVANNTFRDGDDLGGVRVLQRGASKGAYRFEKNRFSNLGGRAYHIHSMEDARIDSQILDSAADNIGVGNRNSDSIIPYLMGRSRQTMLVKGYRYDNTRQVGNLSNTALESFLFGWPREDAANFCTACRLDLTIEDSVFANSVTDGLQFTNYGDKSVVNVVVRNTKVVNPKPKQAMGAIGMTGQKERGRGSKNTILIENSDFIGSSAFGFSVKDESPESTIVIDLGGGALGSKGGNRIIAAAQGAVRADKLNVMTAKNNWWGGSAPVIAGEGQVVSEPSLNTDPRP